jgi:hypothetical protein
MLGGVPKWRRSGKDAGKARSKARMFVSEQWGEQQQQNSRTVRPVQSWFIAVIWPGEHHES